MAEGFDEHQGLDAHVVWNPGVEAQTETEFDNCFKVGVEQANVRLRRGFESISDVSDEVVLLHDAAVNEGKEVWQDGAKERYISLGERVGDDGDGLGRVDSDKKVAVLQSAHEEIEEKTEVLGKLRWQ